MARNTNRRRNANLSTTTTPVYAVIGAGDLAVEKLRDANREFQARSSRISLEPKKLQADVEAVQGKAQSVLHDVLGQAVHTYDDLAGRGKNLVGRIRRQQATQDTVRSANTAKAQAKGAATTAKRNASSTASTAKKNASSTRTQAKKSASQTQSRAKAAGTSARKTAENAGTAAQKSAEKVGD